MTELPFFMMRPPELADPVTVMPSQHDLTRHDEARGVECRDALPIASESIIADRIATSVRCPDTTSDQTTPNSFQSPLGGSRGSK